LTPSAYIILISRILNSHPACPDLTLPGFSGILGSLDYSVRCLVRCPKVCFIEAS
jgi:hypothetical protein